jgi:proline iminopeptidase
MKKNILLTTVLSLLILLTCCNPNIPDRENLLNNISHIEDSLILEIPQVPRLCERMDVEKNYVDIGDCKLYCEIEGEGIPLVLINGGPGGTHHCFHPWLSEAKENFKVIYYDQRGCGQSDYEPGDGYSFEQAVNDLEKLRKALKIEKWILLGHSYGGAISQYYTIKYPEKVLGQVLVGSVPMMNFETFNETRENNYLNDLELQKKNEITGLFRARKLTLAQYLYNKDINGDWKRQHFYKPDSVRQIQMAHYYVITDNTFTSDYELYDFENVFLNCPVPTLIIEGKYDIIWEANKPELLKKYHPNATLKVFEKSGHDLYSDETEKFVEVIEDWGGSLETPKQEEIDNWKLITKDLLGEQLTFIESSKSFIKMIKEKGTKSAKKFYYDFKIENPQSNLFFEESLNALGYEFLFGEKVDKAIELFKLNVEVYPESWNVYDSLGEAYLAKGDKQKAKENYKKSVKLNPDNENGKSVLNELGV